MSGPELTYRSVWESGEVTYRDLRLVMNGRRLVVIDPNDCEQVGRLFDAFNAEYVARKGGDLRDGMQAALLAYASSHSIAEPGIWGVVEASCVHSSLRREWVRCTDGNWYALAAPANPDDWDSLIDPVLVREGVTP